MNLQVLHLDLSLGPGPLNCQLVLPPGSLPHLRELKSNRDFASALLHCPLATGGRPLEAIKGVKLSGTGWDDKFLEGLRNSGENVKRIELAGWNEVDDVKRLVSYVPKLTWLDVGKRSTSTAPTAVSGPANLVSPRLLA